MTTEILWSTFVLGTQIEECDKIVACDIVLDSIHDACGILS